MFLIKDKYHKKVVPILSMGGDDDYVQALEYGSTELKMNRLIWQ